MPPLQIVLLLIINVNLFEVSVQFIWYCVAKGIGYCF